MNYTEETMWPFTPINCIASTYLNRQNFYPTLRNVLHTDNCYKKPTCKLEWLAVFHCGKCRTYETEASK